MKHRSFLNLIGGLALLATLLPHSASASIWVGGVAGVERVSGSSFTLYGGTAGIQIPLTMFGIGAFYLQSNKKSSTLGSFTSEVTQNFYGVEPQLVVGSILIVRPGLKLGLNKVTGRVRVGAVNVASTASDFAAGPSLGVDVKIGTYFSVGVEASYVHGFNATAYNMMLGLGSIKFWLL